MLTVDIVSWVIVGLAIGAIWALLASGHRLKLLGTLICGAIGAVVGGFVFVEESVPTKYSLTALVTSVVGAVIFLFIYAVVADEKPRKRPPLNLPTSPR